MQEIIIKDFLVLILPTLAAFIIALINKKMNEIKVKTNNATVNHYIDILNDTISNTVNALTETTVKKLKAEGKFNEEVGEDILNTAKTQVFNILGESGVLILGTVYSDLNQLIESKIENAVKATK